VILSVWITVFVARVSVCMIVETVGDAVGDPFAPAVVAGPPSTGTTE
jgi:hypothetical protein